MLILSHYPFSVSSQKVRMLLAEKNITWKDKIIDLIEGEQLNDNFIKMNPKAEVPVLQHEGNFFYDSFLINEYLEDLYPSPYFMENDPLSKYTIRQWNMWANENIHVASGIISYLVLGRPQLKAMDPEYLNTLLSKIPQIKTREWRRNILDKGFKADGILESLRCFHNLFQKMERSLQDSNAWLVGNRITLADITVFPYVMRAEHTGLDFMMSYTQYPKLRAWYLRMLSRPSVQTSLLKYVDDNMQNTIMAMVIDANPELIKLSKKL